MKQTNRKYLQNSVMVASFIFLYFMLSYNLTCASLWFDETVEYWYSKILSGGFPFDPNNMSMYDRIIVTYQPPLYNILMFFWLKIYDSEWWFRAFGVLMGMIGGVGAYKSVKVMTGSIYKASSAVVLYSLISRQVYYYQEAAEYALMLGMLSLSVYAFILCLNDINIKNIFKLVIFCILSMYSQYGAVFLVAPFLIIVFIMTLMKKDRKLMIGTSLIYIGAGIFTALPLYVFFLKEQMRHRGSGLLFNNSFSIKEFFSISKEYFIYNMLPDDVEGMGKIFFWIMILILALFITRYLLKGKNGSLKVLLWTNIGCYLFHYFAVFVGLYSDGTFMARRYNLFFIPLWFVSILLLLNFSIEEIFIASKSKLTDLFTRGLVITILIILVAWGLFGLKENTESYEKEDIRGVTEAWYENKAYNEDTFVYYGANMGFTFYLQHHDEYDEKFLNQIIFQKMGRNESLEYYISDLEKIYGSDFPNCVYVVASHYLDDLDTVLEAFKEKGYQIEVPYESYKAKLIRAVQK